MAILCKNLESRRYDCDGKILAIKRFDVVVFKTDTGSILIKRVIGLPGEAVRYETINYMSIISQSLNRI